MKLLYYGHVFKLFADVPDVGSSWYCINCKINYFKYYGLKSINLMFTRNKYLVLSEFIKCNEMIIKNIIE
jgi:hypothetical protein